MTSPKNGYCKWIFNNIRDNEELTGTSVTEAEERETGSNGKQTKLEGQEIQEWING